MNSNVTHLRQCLKCFDTFPCFHFLFPGRLVLGKRIYYPLFLVNPHLIYTDLPCFPPPDEIKRKQGVAYSVYLFERKQFPPTRQPNTSINVIEANEEDTREMEKKSPPI